MSSIPEEIYHEILLRLPVKSLLVCKSVCKKWYALISTTDFVKSHLHFTTHTKKPSLMLTYESRFYSIGYDLLESSVSEIEPAAMEIDFPFSFLKYSVGLVGSCYGLVCLLVDGRREFVCLWNPATREYKKLPPPPVIKINGIDNDMSIFALGYDHKTDDYKLAVGVTCRQSTYIEFHFYSLASNSWKPGPRMTYVFSYSVQRHGLLVNGYHHWLGITQRQCKFLMKLGLPLHQLFLLSLDISDESFKEIQLPKEVLEKSHLWDSIILGFLEGCLCILNNSYVDGVKISVEVWKMLDYGVQESWTRRYIITNESIICNHIVKLVVLRSFENGKILFLSSGVLVLYDPEHGSARKLNNDESFNRIAANYFESLVSLKSGTFVGGGANRGIRET